MNTSTRVRDERLYGRWNAMKQRCMNPNNKKYEHYGKRGITVCDEWLDYKNFRSWAFKNGYEKHLTIDRIDTNGNYEPPNCRWVSQKKQQSNRRNNRIISYKGHDYTLAKLATKHGLDADTLARRLDSGMSVIDAVNKPLNHHYTMVKIDGDLLSLRQACKKLNLPYKTINSRVKRGWSVDKALNTPVRKGNYKRNV